MQKQVPLSMREMFLRYWSRAAHRSDAARQVRCPLYGCDCYAYGLLAAGHCDLVVEADMKPYDYLALVPVVAGAGGRITDWQARLCAAAC